MKIKKCLGCGAILQYSDQNKDGYIEEELYSVTNVCKRCFRLKNYNEYKVSTRTNEDYLNIINNINKTNDLVLYVVDIFNLNYNDDIFKSIKNDIVLVVTKSDIIPKSVKEFKLLNYFDDERFKDVILVSANKNYNLDRLYRRINEYKNSDRVYVIGKTNAGKSTLINKMIKNYSSNKYNITTSHFPNTTLDTIDIKLNDELTLVDTPGIIDNTDFINYIGLEETKIIVPKKEIKPYTFQLRDASSILVSSYVRIDSEKANNLTIFCSNNLDVRKSSYKNDNLKSLKKHILNVKANNDIVVNGLLWIKVSKDSIFELYTYDNVLVYTRKSII